MNSAAAQYIEQYNALSAGLPGRQVDWLQKQRSAELARFTEIGLPTRSDEDWRYTAIKPITNKPFHGLQAAALADLASQPLTTAELEIPGLKSQRLVFVDGLFVQELSTRFDADENVIVGSLAQILEQRPELIAKTFGKVKPEKAHGFTALNNAYSQDGMVVLLAANTHLTQPLEMLFISRTRYGFTQPRNLVIAEKSSKAQLIERYISVNEKGAAKADTLTNSTTEIMLGESAEIDYYLVQTQSENAYQICGIWAKQASRSRFSCRTITLGGALVRNDLAVELCGTEAHCDMLGLYSLIGAQHVDNHTIVQHKAENCSSREWYKGVLDGRSRAVFHGRIKVDPDAQKTNAAQTNNNLLLSKHAEIDSKPQLEIYANDVQCSHGATIGQIDVDALFYLRTRGLDEDAAKKMLHLAFVDDVIRDIQIIPLRDALANILSERLLGDQ